jgi:acetyl-CoA synthetase
VLESAAIGAPHPVKGEEVILFVVLKPGEQTEPASLKRHVTQSLGKPFEPAEVHFVADLPKTRTQKIMRRLIKMRFLGQPLGDETSLMNPGALELIPVCKS